MCYGNYCFRKHMSVVTHASVGMYVMRKKEYVCNIDISLKSLRYFGCGLVLSMGTAKAVYSKYTSVHHTNLGQNSVLVCCVCKVVCIESKTRICLLSDD